MKHYILPLLAITLLASCGSYRSVEKSNPTKTIATRTDNSALNYIRKVHDNALYSKAISASVDVDATVKGNSFNISGKLQMLRGKVIRITLVPFGLMEAGRIEFTPEHVMIVDRINRQYFQLPYSEVDVLKENGMSFYALESLFWNELLVPGKDHLSDSDLSSFAADMSASPTRPVSVSYNNKVSLQWLTDVATALISQAELANSKGSLIFSYSDFVAMGQKKFPSKLSMKLGKGGEKLGITELKLSMSRFSNDANIDANTTLSSRYTKVSTEELLRKLGSF